MRTNPFSSRQPRSLLVALGLLAISLGVTLIASASQTTVVTLEQELSHYWRTTYDILVRPSGSRSAIEEKYGLVEANHLAGIVGGIAYEQYQAIKALPEIEIAAPIAILTYVEESTRDYGHSLPARPEEPGIYALLETLTLDEGARVQQFDSRHYYYFSGSAPATGPAARNISVNEPFERSGFPLSFLLAAIDPVAEAALVGLDLTMERGQYLTGNEPVHAREESGAFGPWIRVDGIPVLINATPYTSMALQQRLVQVVLPPEITTLAEIHERGGADYLDTLPTATVVETTLESHDIYPQLVENLWSPRAGSTIILRTLRPYDQPSRRTYREAASLAGYEGPVLAVAPLPPDQGSGPLPANRVFTLRAKGVFSIDRIPPPADVNRVPLETYFPPVATLLYDSSGRPLEPAVLRPRLGRRSIMLSPPLLLTTMAAARAVTEDECAGCISAVRVRVAGIDELTPQSQRKIEAVAGEIARLTGLDVDIMVGSSPSRVLVHLPDIGYVEEQWVQKNVTIAYRERVQAGHLILLATLLAIGSLFVLDLAWAEVVARRRTIALQKALGWRSSTVFGQVLGHLLLSAVAAPLGALLAWALAGLWGWQAPSARLLLGVPLLVVALSLLGALYPAWLAARVPPIAGLQQGGLRATAGSPGRTFLPPRSLLLLAWQGLARRWSRSALGGLTAMLSAALLVLMLAVTMDRQGAMSGTLLGEFILVRIESYHYAIVAIGFGLAALSLANSLLAGVLERRREIGVLKAVGWRTATVARLFVAEGTLLGLLGGLAGAALGLALFVGLYQSVSSSLGWIAAVGVLAPLLVGALAALYPARVAARIPPAEAVRYE
jgi:hypothetical protein